MSYSIDEETIQCIGAKYRHIPVEILNNALTRYTEDYKITSINLVNIGGIQIDMLLAGELADQFYRFGYQDELAEIIGGEWGEVVITSIVARIEKVAGKIRQSKSENKLAKNGKRQLKQKFRSAVKNMWNEVPSMRGVACAILFLSQNGAAHIFPQRIVEEKKNSLSMTNWPILFEAYNPLTKEVDYYSVDVNDSSYSKLSKIAEHNYTHQDNPDMLQGITVNADIFADLGEVWNIDRIVTPINGLGSSIKVTYSNSVMSAFRSAVYRYIRLEFGRTKDKLENEVWETESRGWVSHNDKHEHERSVEIPFLAISDLWLNGGLTKLEKTILRMVDSIRQRISDDMSFDGMVTGSEILRQLNSGNKKPIPQASFYMAFNSLVKKAGRVFSQCEDQE